ncbi:GreA/GreB family elongation factor [Maribacter sp. ANRC-HE7]|uniref:GreA/GreB family elongation factor n=1 Tax=Maribacter aquimaris TaxID=2737171 RepID=A0ABR7V0P6_9FLAO|nr:GreA/GreB family elongation factor [Maribacter aquimaris]MBD0778407.1 GreA/GreB family elongation factor [Maribacter aquimaris]
MEEKMKYGSLVFEKKDFVMIKRYVQLNHYIEDYAHKDALEALEENMSDAQIYDLEDIPEDIVRLYSIVTVRSELGWCKTFQLVLPSEKDIEKDKLSVQSTLGASVIGLSEGDCINYGLPSNIIKLKIKRVKQSPKHFKVNISEEVFTNVLPKYPKNQFI